MRPNRIHANEIHLDPGRLGRRAKGLDAVTRTSVSANDSFLFCVCEDIHHATEACRPVTFRHAVHETDVDVIGLELTAEAIEVGACTLWVARPSLGHNGDLVTRDMAECLGDMGMTTVGICRIEEAQAM